MQNKKIKTAFSFIELASVLLVIGVIMGVVVASQSIIKASNLNNAKSLTKNSIVNSVNGLVLWLETTQPDNFDDSERIDGSTVTNWYDRNPQTKYPNNATQSGADSLKPTYSVDGINGLPSLNFNGSSEYLTIPYSSSLNTDYFSLFLVIKVTGGTGQYRTPFSSRDGVGKGIMIYARNNNIWASWIGIGSSLYNQINSDAVKIDEVKLLNSNYSANGINSLYDAGSLAGSNSITYVQNSARELRIGAGRNESTPLYYFYGDIGEVILFNRALKDYEREEVEEYLSNKWGIELE